MTDGAAAFFPIMAFRRAKRADQGEDMHHLLLVEDNPDILGLLDGALEVAGYRVSMAGTLAAATHLLEGGDIDMVITDIVLPDGNGTSLAKRAAARGIPALVITGNPHWILALADAGLDYLHKPFRTWQILDRIRARLRPVAPAGS